jgi:hypothetical protein
MNNIQNSINDLLESDDIPITSEAEFIVLTEAAKEVKFIVQILLSMGIPIKLPVICRVDNVRAIFMAEIINTTLR